MVMSTYVGMDKVPGRSKSTCLLQENKFRSGGLKGVAEASAQGIAWASRVAGSEDGGVGWNQSFLATTLTRGHGTWENSRPVA